ncbi:hypothetical protein LNO19_26465 [Klebsiella quasipneumoniae subsp. similipneumoniae]|nr:hypothetical protein [Klebsiella quasipneumoniae subsp. similipneumoniae]
MLRALADQNDSGQAGTVRRYEDEIHTDGETTMTMNLHTPTTAPKAAPATSVSPLEQSGSQNEIS